MAISFITVGDLRPHSVTDRPVKKKKRIQKILILLIILINGPWYKLEPNILLSGIQESFILKNDLITRPQDKSQ